VAHVPVWLVEGELVTSNDVELNFSHDSLMRVNRMAGKSIRTR